MALTKFGFIVTGDSFVQQQGTPSFSMKVVGVKSASEGIAVAQAMAAEGIALIELCGGFSPVWVGKIIETIDYAVPVGAVAYAPESINAMHALFAGWVATVGESKAGPGRIEVLLAATGHFLAIWAC